MKIWIPLTITVLLFGVTSEAAQVTKVSSSGKMFIMSLDSDSPRQTGQMYCVSHSGRVGACGKVIKSNRKGAAVQITKGFGKIAVGDSVTPGGVEGKRRTASEESVSDVAEGPRGRRRIGFYGTVLGDPFPCLFGLNLAYNVTSYLRANVGYSRSSATASVASVSVSSLAVGLKGFVPMWQLSPMLGINYANVSSQTTSTLPGVVTSGPFSANGNVFYATIGLDWQAKFGMDLSAGYNVSFASGVGGLPFFQLGWFFNWF